MSRSPCGERGLKWASTFENLQLNASLPVRGAWIEISRQPLGFPVRWRRSPCGERGLKCSGSATVTAAT